MNKKHDYSRIEKQLAHITAATITAGFKTLITVFRTIFRILSSIA